MQFPDIKLVTPSGSSRTWQFATTDDVTAFAGEQNLIWSALAKTEPSVGPSIHKIAVKQGNFYVSLAGIAKSIEDFSNDPAAASQQQGQIVQLNQSLSQISSGQIMTSESLGSNAVMPLIQSNLQAAATVLYLFNPVSVGELGQLSGRLSACVLYRSILLGAKATPDEGDVLRVRTEYQQAISAFEAKLVSLVEQERLRSESWSSVNSRVDEDTKNWSSSFDSLHRQQNEAWKNQSSRFDNEWDGFRRQLEEQVSLAAPISYWKKRSRALTNVSIAFSVAFVASVSVLIYLFFSLGIPYVKDLHGHVAQNHIDTIIDMIPLLIPAFMGIWILRILGRLLATYVRLSEDARERRTMVETFLAMSREGADGNPLLKPEDRHLILKALFRSSDSNAEDDAPPFGLMDALLKKSG